MAWWEGVDETRILVAPDGATKRAVGNFLMLRHPKSGNSTSYLFDNETIEEIHWFKQSYGSWFLGDYVNEDGHLHFATPVDPVFIFLPIFEEAKMKKDGDLGKFRQLDEILFVNEYPGFQQLYSVAEKYMQIVCEVKDMGSLKFYRLDDSKVLAWLYHKVCQLRQTLFTLDTNFAARDEKDTWADAVSILGEYVRDEPWLKLLCNHLKLNLSEVTRKPSTTENSLTVAQSYSGSSNISQDKIKSGSKITKAGQQAKKSKMEIQSRNIKEMFGRASSVKTRSTSNQPK